MDLCDVVEVMYKTHQLLFKYDFTLNIVVIGYKLTKVFVRHTIFFWSTGAMLTSDTKHDKFRYFLAEARCFGNILIDLELLLLYFLNASFQIHTRWSAA